jgi:Amt family ammonium transporter
MIYSFVVAAVLALAIEKTIGFRLDDDEQETGADLVEHAETGYDLAIATSGGFRATVASSPAAQEVKA